MSPPPVVSAPQLCVQGVNLGDIPAGASISGSMPIRNCGGQLLSWHINGLSLGWLKIDQNSGTLAAYDTKRIPFTVTTNTTDPGPYSTPITITSNGGQQKPPVSMTVVAGGQRAQLCNIQDVNFGVVQAGQTISGIISFSNCGTLPLHWQVPDLDLDWLKLNGSSNTLAPNATETIPITAISPSEARLYTALVPITSDGGNGSALITMTVSPSQGP